MAWQGIVGHDRVAEQFRRAAGRGRLASTFLFVGPPGVGKRTFALKLAQALLCETNPEEEFDPCGACPGCVQVAGGTHPDVLTVKLPEGKNIIPLELFIGDRDHRMQIGLVHDIGLKPFRGGRKIAIVEDADHVNQEGANCLLKTLEEPPPKSVIILLGTSEQRQLPTIRSRCQIVHFRPLPAAEVRRLLLSQGVVEDEALAGELAALSGGSLARAAELADPDLREFRAHLLAWLAGPGRDRFDFAKSLGSFIDAVSKDAPPRRLRFKQVLSFAADFFDALMRLSSGADPRAGDEPLARAVDRAAAAEDGSETWTLCLERCLDARGQVDANANQAALIEAWIDDLESLRA